jgi:hypothetical protein
MTEGSRTRRRAPRRDGDRTTLRVPRELAAQARALAAFIGTTPNDALILFAERGALLYAQELEMARHEERQLAAILEGAGPDDPGARYPPFEEARAAALFLRNGGS